MLDNLPPEILDHVFSKLPSRDLQRLSLTSKNTRASAIKLLWSSVTFKPFSTIGDALRLMKVADFPQLCLQHISHLQFRRDPSRLSSKRLCMHTCANSDNNLIVDVDEEHLDKGVEFSQTCEPFLDDNETPFDCLARQANTFIEQLGYNQLRSFSWDLRTCVPAAVLGRNGTISVRQPSIQSLSLSTNFTCPDTQDESHVIDLSAFQNLQRLHWSAPHLEYFGNLALVLRNNAAHLRYLNLDLVDSLLLWTKAMEWSASGNPEYDNYICVFNYILGIQKDNPQPGPIFQDIRVLSFTQVSLEDLHPKQLVNMKTLTSLTLRECAGWQWFLENMLEMQPTEPIELKKLEIHIFHRGAGFCGNGRDIMSRFIKSFQGLEDLFVCQSEHDRTEPELRGPFDFWESVAHHRDTLKSFVNHYRGLDLTDYPIPSDVGHMDIRDEDLHRLKNESTNPLVLLKRLEFLGLGCAPRYLKNVIESLASESQLKVLHIRQSVLDLEHVRSWARDDPRDDVSEDSAGETLTQEFRDFAEWVLGPQGISSLKLLVYGDFAPSRYAKAFVNTDPIVLVRDKESKKNFRVLNREDIITQTHLDEYRDALEACPIVFSQDLSGLTTPESEYSEV